jgi:hypothetical protein
MKEKRGSWLSPGPRVDLTGQKFSRLTVTSLYMKRSLNVDELEKYKEVSNG